MEKLTALLEEHEINIHEHCRCGWETDYDQHEHLDHLAEMLKPLLAEVWYEGHTTYIDREMDGCRCGAWYEGECGCGKYGTGKISTINPYEKETN